MSLLLPASDSPIRELFDVRDLAEMAQQPAKLPTHRDAVNSAASIFAQDRAAKDVHIVVLRADGELWLERFGRRGAWTCVWNFGRV